MAGVTLALIVGIVFVKVSVGKGSTSLLTRWDVWKIHSIKSIRCFFKKFGKGGTVSHQANGNSAILTGSFPTVVTGH